MLLVPDFLEQSAQRCPFKVALICGEHRLTYADLDGMSNRIANALRDRGVARGDRVVLFLPNGVELAVGIFGVLKADAVFVVANSTMKAEKLTRLIDNCRAATLVTSARSVAVAAEIMRRVPSLKFTMVTDLAASSQPDEDGQFVSFDAVLRDFSPSRPPRHTIDQDLACLIYTSGSTGDSKGVMSSHANVVFATSSITAYLGNVPDDIIISALPLSFDYGLYQLLMAIKFGGTLVLERAFTFPGEFLRRMEQEKVTGFPGVPTMFSVLLQLDLDSFDFSCLRYITNTAAALPVSHIQELARRFPTAAVYSMYGLTETKRTLYLPPDQLHKRPGSVGIAIPGTEVWLVDEDDRRLGPNQVGELVVRGGHVMRGYWGDSEATTRRYRPGPVPGERVCYSGDLFRADEDGYYYFVGRKDDILKCRGEKVAPKEVEDVLHRLHGVVEAAVIGVPDAVLGQAIKAFVVSNSRELAEKDVIGHCRVNLEDFMVPKSVVFVDTLPKNTNGKIDKSRLH